MAKSKPRPAGIALTSSLARVQGDDVELILSRPVVAIKRTHPLLTLRQGPTRVDVQCDFIKNDVERFVLARIPRSELNDGIWRLVLRPGGNRPTRISARLLVQGDRPVVLLMSRAGQRSRIPAPRQRPRLSRRLASRFR